MLRRDFFNTIAPLLGLAALPALSWAKPPRQFLIQHCPLAGFQHHEGEALWNLIAVGDTLELAREPANPHDPNAIRIDWNGRKLGYIPRSQNGGTARMLDEGRQLHARIAGLKTASTLWRRVDVEIWLMV